MNILLVSLTFPPEHCPSGYMINELAMEFHKKGHQVTVITGFPNHPSGVIFNGYRKHFWQIELINGIRVVRGWIFTSPNRNKINRILNFLSFTISSSLAMLFSKRNDIMFAFLEPLTNGLTYPLIGWIKKTKIIFSIQDLHPDSEIDMGYISNKILIKSLRLIEKFSYKRANHLCAICNTFKEHIIRKGISPSKISVLPNWIDTNEIRPLSRENEFRKRCGLANNDFVILYAGTIGYASGAFVLIEVARLLKRIPDIKFLFIGEGPILNKMHFFSEREKLQNMLYLPFQPRELVPLIQATSDISIVTMASGWAKKSVGFASKILGYMAAARPIVAAVDVDSEMAFIINKAECGIVVSPHDAKKIADSICTLIKSPTLRRTLGANGRKYAERFFSRPVVVGKHISLINSIDDI